MNLTIVRENLQQSKQLTGLQPGLYTVKNVTEVESDGSMTLLRRTDELQLTITEPSPTTAPIETVPGGLSILTIMHVLLCVSVLQIPHQLVECQLSSSVGPILGGMSNDKCYHSQFTQCILLGGIKLAVSVYYNSNIIIMLLLYVKSFSTNSFIT